MKFREITFHIPSCPALYNIGGLIRFPFDPDFLQCAFAGFGPVVALRPKSAVCSTSQPQVLPFHTVVRTYERSCRGANRSLGTCGADTLLRPESKKSWS